MPDPVHVSEVIQGVRLATSLDPLETSLPDDTYDVPVQEPHADVPVFVDQHGFSYPPIKNDPRQHESSIEFRHRQYQWHRDKVLRAFHAMMLHENRRIAYECCGNGGWVVQSATDPEKFAVRSNTCRDRWCPACGRARAAVMQRNLEPLLAGRTIRMVTLTRKHTDRPLKSQLTDLYECFTRLRRTHNWSNAVDAGVAFCEVKRNAERDEWHPHLHVLVVGRYVSQAILKRDWLAITKDSHVVDVRIVRNQVDVCRYVTKYLTKPCNNDVYRCAGSLREAIRALKGVRMATTFGDWRGSRLMRNDTIDEWVPIMPWDRLLERCRIGDADAIAMYIAITRTSWEANPTEIEGTPAEYG